MITCLDIGYAARMGNQMFQFAATLGIGRKLGYEVAFPIENFLTVKDQVLHGGTPNKAWFELPGCFTIDKAFLKPKAEIEKHIKRTVEEKKFEFSPRFFSWWRMRDNSNLKGYFQSEKYFAHVKEELLRNFTFMPEYIEEAKKLLPNNGTQLVSIHLRLGDYLALPNHHPVCSPEYYAAAMKHFEGSGYTFVIFSDDLEGAKPYFTGPNVHFFSSSSPYTDMCAMSLCEHNIIANSSFSWWAAYINPNPNKKVIATKRWFGDAYKKHNTKDLYCPDWIVV